MEDSYEITSKDNLILQMYTRYSLMLACKDAEKFARQHNIGIFQQPEFLWCQHINSLKDLIKQYQQDKGGLSKQDFWMLYNDFSAVSESNFQGFGQKPLTTLKRPSNKKNLLSLAQKIVTDDAGEGYQDFKLLVMFRNDPSVINFERLLHASFTLYVPMGRALKRKQLDPTTSFIGNLLDEIKQGYWKDDGFIEVSDYLYRYFYYEFLLAKSNEALRQQYPGLNALDAQSFAKQFLAGFIQLYLIHAFLHNHGIPIGKIKEFAEAQTIHVDYQTEHQEPLEKISPKWNEFIQLITKSRIHSLPPRGSTASESLPHRPSLLDDNSAKMAIHLTKHSKRVKAIADLADHRSSRVMLSPDRIDRLIEEYSNCTTQNPAYALESQGIAKELINSIIDLPKDSVDRLIILNEKFNMVQETIRSNEHWHAGFHDDVFDQPYAGDTQIYIDKMSSAANNWIELVDFFSRLAKISLEHSQDLSLKALIDGLAQALADNAYYLREENLIKILKIADELKNDVLYRQIYNFLEKITSVSKDPEGLRGMLDAISSSRSTPLVSSASNGSHAEKSKSGSRHEIHIRLPKSKKPIKIPLPVNKGIGEVIKTLKTIALFNGANDELIMMVAWLAGEPKRLVAQEILWRQDEKSKSFALITEGELAILFNDGTRSNLVATISSGQAVGDVSLFDDHATRIATVKAAKETIIYEISIPRFKNLMNVSPKLREFMFHHLVQKVYNGQQRLRKLGIFNTGDIKSPLKEISTEQARKLGMHFSIAKRKKKTEIIANADTAAEKLICVEEGELVLVDSNDKEILRLGPNTYCDEVAFYSETGHHPYKVIARANSKYSYINRKQFFGFANREPDLLWVLANTLSKMLRDINTCLTKTEAYKLQAAIEQRNLNNVTKILSAAPIDVNGVCPIENDMVRGTRFIHLVARYNQDKILDLLISHGVNVDEKDDMGNSAAHIAAQYNSLEVLQILQQNKAKINEQNHNHETPLKIAHDLGNSRVINFLTSHGCCLDDLSSPHSH